MAGVVGVVGRQGCVQRQRRGEVQGTRGCQWRRRFLLSCPPSSGMLLEAESPVFHACLHQMPPTEPAHLAHDPALFLHAMVVREEIDTHQAQNSQGIL